MSRMKGRCNTITALFLVLILFLQIGSPCFSAVEAKEPAAVASNGESDSLGEPGAGEDPEGEGGPEEPADHDDTDDSDDPGSLDDADGPGDDVDPDDAKAPGEPDDDLDDSDDDDDDDDGDGEPGEEEEEDPAPAAARYSKAALAALLEQLALEQERGDAEGTLAWLLESPLFDDVFLRALYEGLLEDALRFPGVLDAVEALRELEEPEWAGEREQRVSTTRGEQIAAAAREMERDRGDASRTFAAAGLSGRGAAGTVVSDDPWIAWMDRQVAPALDGDGEAVFRHYTVEASFETQVAEPEAGPADIVLVLDNSLSTQYVLGAQKQAALSFLSQPALARSGSRVALVTFSDDAQLLVELTEPDDPALEQAILDIRPVDMSNLQAGILMARRALDMEDGEIYDAQQEGRRRAVVLLTDGMPNYRYTDIWRYRVEFEGQDTVTYIDIDVQAGGDPGVGVKRWSHADPESVLPFMQKIYMDGEALSTRGVWINNARMAQETARLEAQYLASQGVELYGVNYGRREEYLAGLFRVMETEPDFTASIWEPAYEGAARSRLAGGERLFDPAEPGMVEALCDTVLAVERTALPALTYIDQLGDSFELVADSVARSDRQGEPLDEEGALDLEDGLLTWTLPAGTAPGGYAIRYEVRVRDDAQDPMRYYPDGASAETVSESADILYAEPATHRISFALKPVEIPPLLWIETEDLSALAGERVELKGRVTRGNGDYTYAWYDSEDTLLARGPVPLEGLDPVGGVGLDLPVPVCAVSAPPGEAVYYLEVTDRWAWGDGDGYSGGRLRVPVRVVAVEASLTIRVEGAGGRGIPGRFEVTIHRERTETDPAARYHYIGLGEVTYTADSGLARGSYDIGAYAPYGYRVSAQSRRTVRIEPVRGADGAWLPCHEEVVITLEPTRPGYFHCWAWGER